MTIPKLHIDENVITLSYDDLYDNGRFENMDAQSKPNKLIHSKTQEEISLRQIGLSWIGEVPISTTIEDIEIL